MFKFLHGDSVFIPVAAVCEELLGGGGDVAVSDVVEDGFAPQSARHPARDVFHQLVLGIAVLTLLN